MLIVITPPQLIAGELSNVIKMFQAGLERLHLRKPGMHGGELRKFIHAIPAEFHDRIVLHGSSDQVAGLNLAGVHNPSERSAISRSMHQIDELAGVAKYSYVMFSPVFESISKAGHRPRYTKSEIAEALAQYNGNVVALGGVCRDNLPIARRLGFAGVATIGAIWRDADPVNAYVQMRTAWEEGH